MENINYKVWVAFYQEFANQLLKYKDDRKDLIKIVKQVYDNKKINLPTLDKDNNITDIDPFTIFALFNKQITKENRITIATEFAKLLDMELEVPTEFDGIPLAMNLSATFYYFEDERGNNDIQILWDVFEGAIDYSNNSNEENKKKFESAFDTALTQKGVKWNLTMGLFWIRPYSFVNLDTLNRNYLIEIKDIFDNYPKLKVDKVPKFDTYISLCDDVKNLCENIKYEFSNFPELSHYAYIKDDVVNYWWLNANPKIWSFSSINVGEKESYELYNENGNKRRIFQNFIDAKKDDILVVYETSPMQKIVGFAKIVKEQDGKYLYFEKTSELESYIEFERLKNCIELENMEYLKNTQGSLFKLTKKEYDFIISLVVKKNNFKNNQKQYWIYSPGSGADMWEEFYIKSIMGIAWSDLGDFRKYDNKEDIKSQMQKIYDENRSFRNDALAVWQFANKIEIGDIVYVKKGVNTIIGRGIVKSNYIYDEKRETYKNIREIEWTDKVEFEAPEKLVTKTLTDLTIHPNYLSKIKALFGDNDDKLLPNIYVNDSYTKDNFLREVYMSDEDYDTLTLLLSVKKNVILQGAPGVGKTFIAKRLAYAMMEECDISRVSMIQFHQSYSYEDFIMGYKPNDDGFELVDGVFYKFCKKAQDDNERDYFFIIDEINRGNLSKIFGELFMLIENDKRDLQNSIRLVYADEQFYIPSNVHIIGMMNTADRSLSMVDFALRRRFAFFDINPAFENESFIEYQKSLNNTKFDKLLNVVKKLNVEITDDISLGSGFRIGHSYFTSDVDDIRLKMIVNFEIIPLLKEYWFDEMEKVEEWTKKLQGAIM